MKPRSADRASWMLAALAFAVLAAPGCLESDDSDSSPAAGPALLPDAMTSNVQEVCSGYLASQPCTGGTVVEVNPTPPDGDSGDLDRFVRTDLDPERIGGSVEPAP